MVEDEMQHGKDEYELRAPYSFGAGREAGRQEGQVEGVRSVVLMLIDRHGAVRDDLWARVEACDAPAQLRSLAVEIAAAPDRATVERLLAGLPPARDT